MVASVETATKVLNAVSFYNVATADQDGQPWNSPVFAALDHDLNIYWCSWRDNVHSQNIAHNDRVFIVGYSAANEHETHGVYFKARAKALETQDEVVDSLKYYESAYGPHSPAEVLESSPRRMYKAVPSEVWTNDESEVDGQYVDIRVPIDIEQLKESMQ